MTAPVTVGIIGAGNIFPQYIKGCRMYDCLKVVGVADLNPQAAAERSREFDVPALSMDAMLDDPTIELIVNLTVPAAHVEVATQAMQHGKHVYNEKPLALNAADGAAVLAAAQQTGKLVGCAPDTFLGGGLQTCRHLIDAGTIGRPVAAAAFMLGHGPEAWHPNPGFFYRRGGGPLYDMGPYYLTALISLLGGIESIAAVTTKAHTERIATSPTRLGERLPVEVNTHVAGTLRFVSGAVVTFITSFDVWAHRLPNIEIYGTEGTLSVPDPNSFGGLVRVYEAATGAWRDVPLTHSDAIGRGTGVADLAMAIRTGRPQRASGALAYHVLEAMDAFDVSSASGTAIGLAAPVERPAALPVGLAPGAMD